MPIKDPLTGIMLRATILHGLNDEMKFRMFTAMRLDFRTIFHLSCMKN